jgi:hypothetical protein
MRIPNGGDSASKKCERGCGGVYGGAWSQAVGFASCVWQESGFSRREDVFTFNLFHKEI